MTASPGLLAGQNRKSLRILPRPRRVFERERLENADAASTEMGAVPTPYLASF
jgi:hypothetical protein